MKDARIIELMAGLEFGSDVHIRPSKGMPDRMEMVHHPSNAYVPHYPTSHDATQRVVEGLSNLDKITASTELVRMATEANVHCAIFILTATPRQKCEAILKAKGLWEQEQNDEN